MAANAAAEAAAAHGTDNGDLRHLNRLPASTLAAGGDRFPLLVRLWHPGPEPEADAENRKALFENEIGVNHGHAGQQIGKYIIDYMNEIKTLHDMETY